MKKIAGIIFFAFLIAGISANRAYSQNAKDTIDTTTIGQDLKKAGKATGKAAEKAGKKVKEAGANVGAEIKDKALKDVKGPEGETVYIDKYGQRYFINENGKKVYLQNEE